MLIIDDAEWINTHVTAVNLELVAKNECNHDACHYIDLDE